MIRKLWWKSLSRDTDIHLDLMTPTLYIIIISWYFFQVDQVHHYLLVTAIYCSAKRPRWIGSRQLKKFFVQLEALLAVKVDIGELQDALARLEDVIATIRWYDAIIKYALLVADPIDDTTLKADKQLKFPSKVMRSDLSSRREKYLT